jgi:hypothetical protein
LLLVSNFACRANSESHPLRLQPVDPNIDTPAMPALPFCHLGILQSACSHRSNPMRPANPRFRQHAMM